MVIFWEPGEKEASVLFPIMRKKYRSDWLLKLSVRFQRTTQGLPSVGRDLIAERGKSTFRASCVSAAAAWQREESVGKHVGLCYIIRLSGFFSFSSQKVSYRPRGLFRT